MALSYELQVEASIEALIKKLNNENLMLNNCDFGNIRAIERDGDWKTTYNGFTYVERERDVVFEVFDKETENGKYKPFGIYLHQFQKKIVYESETGLEEEYEFSKIQKVQPIKGTIINSKWVIEEC